MLSLERLVSEKLKEFLSTNNILSENQSGFRKEHSTISASLKVVNDIIEAQDSKKTRGALFYRSLQSIRYSEPLYFKTETAEHWCS